MCKYHATRYNYVFQYNTAGNVQVRYCTRCVSTIPQEIRVFSTILQEMCKYNITEDFYYEYGIVEAKFDTKGV